MRKPIIGVMGAGRGATAADCDEARELGKLIAEHDWVLLSGGTALGVMDASCHGAHEAGGLVVGVIAQADDSKMSNFVDVPIFTGMLSGRNIINALSSDVVVACGTMATGTLSEIALALRSSKDVVLLSAEDDVRVFLKRLGGDYIHLVASPNDAVSAVENILSSRRVDGADNLSV